MTTPPALTPTHQESLALFRHAVVGDLVLSDLPRGELQDELKHRAERKYRPPGARASRTYHWKTLQRWLYSARDGLLALQPASRQRGFALDLTHEARLLLLDIRREHPHVAAELLLDAAVAYGAVRAISLPTLRRLYAREGLSRTSRPQRAQRAKDRRRWEADRVGRIWHADVAHVWLPQPDGTLLKVYVHGILDDHSRYLVALRASVAETENDLLELLVEALLRFPAPDVFYVDNGSTYRGELLTLAMGRLGVKVVHAEPYDPEARGKMERFWRTMRQRLLDTGERPSTLHHLNAALAAWIDADYHRRPHGGLKGDTPGRRFRQGLATLPSPRPLEDIAAAMEVQRKAKVMKDATFSVNGTRYEVQGRHLAGQRVEVLLDPFTQAVVRVQHDGQTLLFGVCDPRVNAQRGRGKVDTTEVEAGAKPDRFQRIARLLQDARGVRDAA